MYALHNMYFIKFIYYAMEIFNYMKALKNWLINSCNKISHKKARFIVLSISLILLMYNTCFFSCDSDTQDEASPLELPTWLKKKSTIYKAGSKIETEKTIQSSCLENLNKYEESNFYHINETAGRLRKDLKTILVLVGNFGDKHFGFGFGVDPFEAACCKESRCLLTPNRNYLPIEDFDAIVFHYRSFSLMDLPKKRSPHQMYVLFDLEPSAYLYQNPKIYDSVFNLTWNFREDADVTFRYDRVLPKSLLKDPIKSGPLSSTQPLQPKKNFAEGKTKLIAWFVSRCSSSSWRENYAEKLNKYIPVDVYGSCGNKKCLPSQVDECYEYAEKNYKFYLSFENSICKDYITEKFYNIFRYDMIPIVYGGGDYEAFVPSHSFINVLDFKNVQSLAQYLNYLDLNDTAYNEYFKWKKDYFLPSYWGHRALSLCELCEAMHKNTSKIYHNLSDYLKTKADCTRMSPISWWERFLTSDHS